MGSGGGGGGERETDRQTETGRQADRHRKTDNIHTVASTATPHPTSPAHSLLVVISGSYSSSHRKSVPVHQSYLALSAADEPDRQIDGQRRTDTKRNSQTERAGIVGEGGL